VSAPTEEPRTSYPPIARPRVVCPRCHGAFTAAHGIASEGELSCSCSAAVAAAGVVVVDPPPRLLAAVRRGPAAGLRALLGRHWWRARANELAPNPTFRRMLRHAALGRLASSPRIGAALNRHAGRSWVRPIWGACQWHLYMRHRFATPSFVAATAALGLVDGRAGLILDAPCGMGHLTHRLGRVVDPARIVALDLDPVSAYATRRFLAPQAGIVLCGNLDDPLPLPDAVVAVAFCVDAFHYVERKEPLARELVRVLRDDGVLALLHVHNRLQDNPTPGHPLAPAEYAALFPGCVVRMVPEEDLLDAAVSGTPLDVSCSASADRLDAAAAIAVFVAKREDALGEVPSLRARTAAEAPDPQLAETYEAVAGPNGTAYRRRLPPTLSGEYPEMARILPRWVADPGPDDRHQLVQIGVLADLPEAY